jgi:hypothetical protein
MIAAPPGYQAMEESPRFALSSTSGIVQNRESGGTVALAQYLDRRKLPMLYQEEQNKLEAIDRELVLTSNDARKLYRIISLASLLRLLSSNCS